MESKNVDIVAFGAHPDDVEAGCSGFVISMVNKGKKVAIVDLSLGELSSNATIKERQEEAKIAAEIMGVSFRENLGLPNNFFSSSKENQTKIIEAIRKYRPEIILLPHWMDRHPDHMDVYKLVWPSLFTGGLLKFETGSEPHRPKYVFFYRLWYEFTPSFIFDVSDVFDKKVKAILAHKSQFIKSDGLIVTKDNRGDFIEYWKARHRDYGYEIGVEYGEPFLSMLPLGIKDLESVLPNYS